MVSPTVEIIDLTESATQHPVASSDAKAIRSTELNNKYQNLQEGSATTGDTLLGFSDNGSSMSLLSRISLDKGKPKNKKKSGAGMDTAIASKSVQDLDTTISGKLRDRESNGNAAHLESPSSPSIFFLDDRPSTPSVRNTELPKGNEPASSVLPDLLLPEHIQVHYTKGEVLYDKEDSPRAESDEDDFILYADMHESRNTFARYYEEPDSNDRLTHYVCGHCGAEGEHKTSDCPVLICLTCGAHNEHSTRQCPISKSCFTCGLKGHISKDCTNRNASRRTILYDNCSRCGSREHNSKECPTLWRIYNYVEDKERDATLQTRGDIESMAFEKGIEVYIGTSLWCYNCGNEGHLGDDCDAKSHPYDHPREPSAFSYYNILSGPFSDRDSDMHLRKRHKRSSRDDDGYPGPSSVGKRGREKERERMSLREEESRLSADEEDWFRRRLKFASDNAAHHPVKHNERKRDSKPSIRIQSNFNLDGSRSRESLQFAEDTSAGKKRLNRERKRRANDARPHHQKAEVHDNDRDIPNDKARKRRTERDHHGRRDNRRNSNYEPRRDEGRRKERNSRQYYGGYGI